MQRLTVENRTGEVTNELLEKVGLLAGDFVEAIALATLLDLVGGETGAKLGVEDWRGDVSNKVMRGRCDWRRVVWWRRGCMTSSTGA